MPRFYKMNVIVRIIQEKNNIPLQLRIYDGSKTAKWPEPEPTGLDLDAMNIIRDGLSVLMNLLQLHFAVCIVAKLITYPFCFCSSIEEQRANGRSRPGCATRCEMRERERERQICCDMYVCTMYVHIGEVWIVQQRSACDVGPPMTVYLLCALVCVLSDSHSTRDTKHQSCLFHNSIGTDGP